ncbi:MAG: hypothetical protein M1832_001643 [Thelocarpon impressellum]|nr:MAG: hypothetical protein M1832_001643 [Thelocarpon impressellum]
MAEQPDISSILAALAAQRPAAAPAQGSYQPQTVPQPGMPQGYQSSYPPSAPAVGLAGIQLPQPTNSGSVDLSNIKPTASGTGIAEAIAKAKGIAAEKGVSYDQRGPGRGTSASGDDNVETILIDSSLVGLIIGRQGENLRRVEGETRARVQFVTAPDMGGPSRSCKITGDRTARNQAKEEIYRIIDDNGRPGGAAQFDRANRAEAGAGPGTHQPALRDGEDSMQIMVPDRTVGLIIGRGGETIRDLQERSGCHVNIVGEQKSVNGLRPVNLIGSQQAAAMAKELIMEIVDSDTKSLAGQGPPQREPGRGGLGGFGGGGGGGGFGGGDRINDSIRVPSEAVGMIIGKGGETIKDMQNTTGCKINVSQQSGPGETDREIGLVGSRDAIEQAKRAIEEKVDVVRGGGRRREDPYSDRYSQSQQSYGQGSGPGQGQAAQAQAAAPTAAEADPYAAYGGYQNYVAMWYAAMAQQQQQGQGQGTGEQSGPPGAS